MSSESPPYPAWIYRQSGVLPYRWCEDALQVLLISSRGGKRWVLPKGIVEPGMSALESARKEAREEAGVEGAGGDRPLGSYRYGKWGGTCEVEVYPLRISSVLDEWPESGLRRRRWLSLHDAASSVDRKGLRQLMARLPAVALSPDAPWSAETPPAPVRLVYLFRHAKSSWEDPALEDFDRPLAARGIRACEAMQRYMALGDVHPQQIVCSAAVRTTQTLERVLSALGEQPVVQYYRGLYLAGPQAMLERLGRTDDAASSVMLVAHNPGTQSLALRLVGSGDAGDLARLRAKFPTGALATLIYRGEAWGELDAGSCELHSFVCPREIGKAPPD